MKNALSAAAIDAVGRCPVPPVEIPPASPLRHPRAEHLIPLMVALSAGADEPASHDLRDQGSAGRFGLPLRMSRRTLPSI